MNLGMFGCIHEEYGDEVIKMDSIAIKILLTALVILLMACTAAGDEAEIDPDADVNVTVNAPEYVSEDTFEVTIDVTEVTGLNSGQFDLIYDPDVLKVQSVKDGNIDDTEIPKGGDRHFTDDGYDRYRIIFKLDGDNCVSGSGYISKIVFKVVGSVGDNSIINVFTDPDGAGKVPTLSYIEEDAEHPGRYFSYTFSANWFGTNVTIGTAPPESAGTPTPTPAETLVVNATPELESTSAPSPTATLIETESLEISSNPFAMTASAKSAPTAAVPDTSSGGNKLPNMPTSHNLIPIYSLVGLFALIYTLTQFR